MDKFTVSGLGRFTMPVDLNAIPPAAPVITRPCIKRWCILFILSLAAGMALTLLFWRADRSGGAFWFVLLGLPCAFTALCFLIRRLGYKSQQVWAEAWDGERERLKQREIARGQRGAWLIAQADITAITEEDGGLAGILIKNIPKLAMLPPRQGGSALRHTHLADDVTLDASGQLQQRLLMLAGRLRPTLELLPPDMPCYLALQIEAGLPPADVEQAWRVASVGFQHPMIPLVSPELSALDNWLDDDPQRPSAFMIIALQVNNMPRPDSGEAAVGLLMTNVFLSQLPRLAQIHRPHRGADMSMTIRFALLWANNAPASIKRIWLAGDVLSRDSQWHQAREDNQLQLDGQADCHYLDNLLGDTGVAAPWLALAAAGQCRQNAGAQLMLWLSPLEQCWAGCISSATAPREGGTAP